MAAIIAAENGAEVTVFEKSAKFLSKVKVSGGGRCNVTHQPLPARQFLDNYPRGTRILKKCIPQFDPASVMQWFEDHGVDLKIEEDGRVFPVSDRSTSVMDALLNTARDKRVQLKKKARVREISQLENGQWELWMDEGDLVFDRVIIATGGNPSSFGYEWLRKLDIEVIPPVPSLFTFNIPVQKLRDLTGLAVSNATIKVEGMKLKTTGPLLVTHWGISGPAVLKISAFAARELSDMDYNFSVAVNWLDTDQDTIRGELTKAYKDQPQKNAGNVRLGGMPERMWKYLLERSGISSEKPCVEIGSKMMNRLVETLNHDRYHVHGKTTFKEEFVTAGGVAESEVDPATMECRKYRGLYFCGEVLDIDGVTGGFNFQAAWSTGYVAGKNAAQKIPV